MKVLLKWMTGRRVVKLTSVHVGNAKKFLYSPYTESSEAPKEGSASSVAAEDNKASAQGGKGRATRGQRKNQAAALQWWSMTRRSGVETLIFGGILQLCFLPWWWWCHVIQNRSAIDVLKQQCVVGQDSFESVMFRRIVRMEAAVLHAWQSTCELK